MKRMLILVMVLTLLWTGGALAAEGQNANLFLRVTSADISEDIRTIVSAAGIDSTLYVLTNSTLEKWTPGMSVPEQVMEGIETFAASTINISSLARGAAEPSPVFSLLFTSGDLLLGLDTESGRVWKLTEGGEELIAPSLYASLDWSGMMTTDDFGDTFFSVSVKDMEVREDSLWLVGFDFDRDPFGPAIFRWNLLTGEAMAPLMGTHVQELAPYKDGNFLCLIQPVDEEETEEPVIADPVNELGLLEAETGAVTKLATLDAPYPNGLAYDAAADTAYYLDGCILMSLPKVDAAPQRAAYFPLSSMENSGIGQGLLAGGMYYLTHFDGVFVRAIDPENLEQNALVIYGARDNRPAMALLSEHPEIFVRESGAFYDTDEELITAIEAGTDAPDVILLDMSAMPIERLLAGGYALDLSENKEITSIAQDMAPVFVDAASKDGKLHALPLQMDGFLVAYHEAFWAELGLTESDLPTTYGELLDFAADWENKYAKDYPDISLFDRTDIKGELISTLVERYIAMCQRDGLPIDFTNEAFRSLMVKLDAIPQPPSVEEAEAITFDEVWNEALFSTYFGFGQFYSDDALIPLPLSFEQGQQPIVPASLFVAMVNAKTGNPEAAALYLQMLTRYFDETGALIVLFPGNNAPVPYALFDEEVQLVREQLAVGREQIGSMAPEDVENMQSSIAFWEALLENPEQYITRELVSERQIQLFRERIEPYLNIAEPNPLFFASETGDWFGPYTLYQQYMDGSMTLDQLLTELNTRVSPGQAQ